MNDPEGTGHTALPSPESGSTARGLHVVKFFTAVFLSTMVILTGLVWHTWHSYRQFRADQTRNFRTVELAGVITHLDEVLTMSARMAAATGDPQWEKRYRVFEPQLDGAIQEAMGLWPELFISEAVSQTNLANIKLVDMENKAFDSVRQGDLDSATEVLYSAEYEKQKEIYSNGMLQVTDSMRQRVQADVTHRKRMAVTIVTLLAVLLALALAVWMCAMRTLKRYVANPEATCR
ncbi:MAG: hypothetical protein JSU70_03845 [Phycisphaerales bacterium]|nr:MAG: hypothetical protein JSU70_03845 [Phycisphaerales bacterium]